MGFARMHMLLFVSLNLLSAGSNARAVITIWSQVKIDQGFKTLIVMDAINIFILCVCSILTTILEWILDLELHVLSCTCLWLVGLSPITLGMMLTTATAAFRLRSLQLAMTNRVLENKIISMSALVILVMVYLYCALLYYLESTDPGRYLVILSTCNDINYDADGLYKLTIALTATPNVIFPISTLILDGIIVKYLQTILSSEDRERLKDAIAIPIKATVWSAAVCLINSGLVAVTVILEDQYTKSSALLFILILNNMVRVPVTLKLTFKMIQDRDEEKKRQSTRLALQQREIRDALRNRQLRRHQLQVQDIETHI